jgi:hypothetical protein
MDASLSLLAELKDSAAAGSDERLGKIAQGVATLFLARSQDYSDEQIALFDDVLAYLIDKIETRVLIELGEQLARQRRAPPRVIKHLAAHDDIAVAGPVLARSKRLAETDLIRIIETKSQTHLYAIAQRPRVPESVTDALLRHGERRVVRRVAGNPGARFSSTGFDALASRAGEDDVLAETVARRPDVPVEVVCQLIAQASEEARKRLIAYTRPELHADIERAVASVSDRMIEEEIQRHDYEAAARRLLMRCPDGKVYEDDVIDLLPAADTDQLVVALTLMSELPVDLVERAMSEDSGDLLLIICKVLDFGWTTVRGILTLKLGSKMTSDVVTAACEDFSKMSRLTAQQMLKLWKRGQVH